MTKFHQSPSRQVLPSTNNLPNASSYFVPKPGPYLHKSEENCEFNFDLNGDFTPI